MVDLKDWDLPLPGWVILGWLGLLEALFVVGLVAFVVSLYERGGIIPSLPLPRSPLAMFLAVVVLTVVFTVFKMEDTSLIDLVGYLGR